MTLSPRSIILLTLAAFSGHVEGKTLLQKRLYFLDELLRLLFGETPRFRHDAHYYGPYSSLIGDELASLQALGFVQESSEAIPLVQTGMFEPRRYSYRLTEAGQRAATNLRNEHTDEVQKLDKAIERIRSLGNVDYMQLSIAAKCHHIFKRSNQPLSAAAVADAAQRFSWQVTPEQAQRGFQMLQKLGLAETTPTQPKPAAASFENSRTSEGRSEQSKRSGHTAD
jgi:uncharacterized protein YwgA